MKKKGTVFILLGQSNAVGHNLQMEEKNKIIQPLKNVFGLHRSLNQTFNNDRLFWSGYTSSGMNLGEEQDDTYSIANCLARLWQDEIDSGSNLEDLYIIHIAVGAQGVTEEYMWSPYRKEKLIPGKLGEVDISLYPLTKHILSLVNKSLDADFLGLHWRGGENDVSAHYDILESSLKCIYDRIFDGFFDALGCNMPTFLHKIVCHDRYMDMDSSGEQLKKMHIINEVFEAISKERNNVTIFDVTNAPQYIEGVRGNGIFIEDAVHFTREVNEWVAEEILKEYKNR